MLLRLVFRLFFIVILAFCSVLRVSGQFVSDGADAVHSTLYFNSEGNNDPIFVFNNATTGDLSLELSGLYIFEWFRLFRFDNEQLIHVTPNYDYKSSMENLSEGGYMVKATPKEEDDPHYTFVAWLYMNPGFDFSLYKNPAADNAFDFEGYQRHCERTDFFLNSNTIESQFEYYDPQDLDKKTITLVNVIRYSIKPGDDGEITEGIFLTSQERAGQFLTDNFSNPGRTPPRTDMEYIFRARDMFGVEKEDYVYFQTILPNAEIKELEMPDDFSAELPVTFISEPRVTSYQNFEYEWRFGDRDRDGNENTFTYDHNEYEGREPPDVENSYFTPNTPGYRATLFVTSRFPNFPRCVHSTQSEYIRVDLPSLEVANVFTPNGLNPYFKPYTVSLRQFEILIFTRAGRQVFYYKGNDLRDWQGWNGETTNSGQAPTGVYYYTLRALGWDEPATLFPQGEYNGFFYLFR